MNVTGYLLQSLSFIRRCSRLCTFDSFS